MSINLAILVPVIGLSAVVGSTARADVFYTVLNPARNFTLFEYDSAQFITTDTVVPVGQLAFANPANPIISVEFIASSSTYPGTSEVDVVQSGAAEQARYYPQGTFTEAGVTPGDSNSFGYPSSELSVAVPEPTTIALIGVGLFGLAALRYRPK